MLKSLLAWLNDFPIYIKVFENKIEIRCCDGNGIVLSKNTLEPFSTDRLLVGHFSAAEKLMREGLKEMSNKSMISPKILIHGIDKCENGLSEYYVN